MEHDLANRREKSCHCRNMDGPEDIVFSETSQGHKDKPHALINLHVEVQGAG